MANECMYYLCYIHKNQTNVGVLVLCLEKDEPFWKITCGLHKYSSELFLCNNETEIGIKFYNEEGCFLDLCEKVDEYNDDTIKATYDVYNIEELLKTRNLRFVVKHGMFKVVDYSSVELNKYFRMVYNQTCDSNAYKTEADYILNKINNRCFEDTSVQPKMRNSFTHSFAYYLDIILQITGKK